MSIWLFLRKAAAVGTATVVLGGCSHSLVSVNTSSAGVRSAVPGTTITQSSVQASSDTRLGAAIVIAVMLADGLRYFRVEPDGRRTPVDEEEARRLGASPQPAPNVSVQDCSRPVDLSAGNLMCR